MQYYDVSDETLQLAWNFAQWHIQDHDELGDDARNLRHRLLQLKPEWEYEQDED